jgi:hypothetical protein
MEILQIDLITFWSNIFSYGEKLQSADSAHREKQYL